MKAIDRDTPFELAQRIRKDRAKVRIGEDKKPLKNIVEHILNCNDYLFVVNVVNAKKMLLEPYGKAITKG